MSLIKQKRNLNERLKKTIKRISKEIEKRNGAIRQIRQERRTLRTIKREIKATEKAQQIFQGIAKEVQESVHKNIAGIVTRCLGTVFEDSAYEFQINFERTRGKTEARLSFVRGDTVFEDPPEECSGGQVQVAAFALRLACLLLSSPKRRKIIVLDEPFLGIDKFNADRIKLLLEGLAKDLKIQIIMVTHNEGLVAGKVHAL